MPPSHQMSPDELREIVRETVKETVNETLMLLGIDTKSPIEMQKDFQHLHDWRVTTESMKSKVIVTVLGVVVSGALAALWIGIKSYIK